MNLKLKQEYVGADITLSFTGKGGAWHYNVKNLKPSQYQILFDNGYQHLFDVDTPTSDETQDMPLFEEDEPKGLVDYTSYKKKAVTAKTSKKNDNL